jgi:hypothetical protein
MHSVSKLYDTKGELEWEAFNAGNDVLCFAENVPEGILEILKNASPERIDASYNRIMNCKKKVGLLDSKSEIESRLDFKTASLLNTKIAQQSITTIKDSSNHDLILEASKNQKLAVVSIYKNLDNVFSKMITDSFKAKSFSIENANEIHIEKYTGIDTIIIALFVPKAKPMQNFEIEDSVLELLSELFETKKCILYLFGNPYALQVIPNLASAKGIIQAYQDFNEFQETAARLLLNNKVTQGSLPVALKGI